MKVLRIASALALAVTMSGTAAQAVSLAQAAKPAETPPGSYRGDVYVDSRGCAYVRATIGSTVNWVPRLTRDRKQVVCGLTPTASVAGLAQSRPPAPPAPPPPSAIAPAAAAAASAPAAALRNPLPTTARQTAPAPAAANAVNRTMQVTCPANGSAARVRIGGDTVAIQCAPGQTTAKSYIVRHANGARTRVVANPPAATARPTPVASTARGFAATTATTGRSVGVGAVLSGGRVVIGGRAPRSTAGFGTSAAAPARTTAGGYTFGNGFGLGATPGPLDPVPRVTSYGVTPRAGTSITITPGVATQVQTRGPRVIMPEGYRPAWTDGRLNPDRGPRSVRGDLQMAATMTIDQVPMRTVNPATPRGLLVETQPTLGTFFSSKSPNVAPQTVVQPSVARTMEKRYVQVGAFT
ncbi:MAG TPA: hypothetical protein ENK63_02550, partial [Rhodobacterales bacterium]|nr:hypothetical protein [Rhodobacterales bacterium]